MGCCVFYTRGRGEIFPFIIFIQRGGVARLEFDLDVYFLTLLVRGDFVLATVLIVLKRKRMHWSFFFKDLSLVLLKG